MKILHITPNKKHPCLSNFIRAQAKSHEVFLVVLELADGNTYDVGKEYDNDHIKCLKIKAKKIVDFEYDNKLKVIFDYLIKNYRPDIIHMHLFSGISVIPILNVASSLEIKRVITMHDHSLVCLRGTYHNGSKKCKINSVLKCNCNESKYFSQMQGIPLIEYNRIRQRRTRDIINTCDKLICCSYSQKKMICQQFGNHRKFCTLYYGVELPKINKVLRKKSKSIVFGYLGSLHPLKGIDVLERAIQYLDKYKFEILMAVIHDENNQQEKNFLKNLKRKKSIKILKNIMYKDFYSIFFSQIDYLVIPSIWEETGPMTLFESFFYEVPVIISNQASMVEKIRGNKSSKVFNNSNELAQIMKKIIKGEIKKEKNDIFNFKSINRYSFEIDSLYQNSINKQIKTLKLKTGYLCNNRCIFCVTGDNAPRTFLDFKLIRGTLERYRKDYSKLILTGGEPSIRKDFFMILELAYRLGYKIILETNARIFSDEQFCERIKYYNIDITTHIESYKPNTHDFITRVPDSFFETIAGIRHLRKNCRKITVKIMLTKFNYKHILYTVKFLTGLGVDTIWSVFLTPQGHARQYFDLIMPTYLEVMPFVNKALIWLKNNSKISIVIENFPYCIVDPEFINYMMEKPIEDKRIMFGIFPDESPLNEHKYYIFEERPIQKKKFTQCSKCKLDRICEGVYKEYAEKKGSEEFIPIK